MSIIDTLITNRAGGYYNTTDLNRIAEAVEYVNNRLMAAGFDMAVTAKQDWAAGDIPNVTQMTAYLADIAAMRAALAVRASTPSVPPDMDDLTAEEANDIERILRDVDGLIDNMIAAYHYSGEIYSGEFI